MRIFKRSKMDPSYFCNFIAERTEVEGNINFSANFEVHGRISGNLLYIKEESKNNSVLKVGETGCIIGNEIRACNMIIDGNVTVKEIWCEDELHISSTAQIKNATIYYRFLKVEEGAILVNCNLKHLDHVSEGETV